MKVSFGPCDQWIRYLVINGQWILCVLEKMAEKEKCLISEIWRNPLIMSLRGGFLLVAQFSHKA